MDNRAKRIHEYWLLYDKYYNLNLEDTLNQNQYFSDLKRIMSDEILNFEEKTWLINHISGVTITFSIVKKYDLDHSSFDSK